MNEIQSLETKMPRPSYVDFSKAVETAFNKLALEGRTLYRTSHKKGALRSIFLNVFPEGPARQYENCDCCGSFLGRYGNLAYIEMVNDVPVLKAALWNNLEGLDPHWESAVTSLRDAVEKSDIKSVWYSDYKVLGTKEAGGFNHLHIERISTHTAVGIKSFGQMMAETIQNYNILSKTVGTADLAIIDNALKYFKHDAKLCAHKERADALAWFRDIKTQHQELKDQRVRKLLIWNAVGAQYMDRLRIGQSVMGEFLDNLKNGVSFEAAKGKFLDMVDALKHKRATTPPKAGTVMQAEKMFEIMGLVPSLPRRFAALSEMRHTTWSPKAEQPVEEKTSGAFSHLATKQAPPQATELPEVVYGPVLTWERFAAEVLPKAEKLQARTAPGNMNYMSVSAPVDMEAKPILKWDNEEHRNPFAEYLYYGGSPAQVWNLKPNTWVEVESIVVAPTAWAEAEKGETELPLILVLKGAQDLHMAENQIPLGAQCIRHDLHEVRSVIENYFKSGKLAEQPEDKPPFGGLFVAPGPNSGVGIVLRAFVEGVWVQYQIDRYK